MEFKTPLFRTEEIRKRIMKREYGAFIVGENGRKIIYSVAYLDIWNMYFVVVADYDELIRHVESL